MYYPKSQITKNLYTNGNEFEIASTKEVYTGYYYTVSSGNSFVGNSPSTTPTPILLLPITQNPKTNSNPLSPKLITSNPASFESNYTNKINERYIPQPSSTTPTPQNYQLGTFPRFLCKRNNQNLYFEIDKSTFTDLKNNSPKIASELYTPILVNWILSNSKELMFNANKSQILFLEKENSLFGFSLYFKNNFSQYYQNSTQENLYTSGGEYTTKNGKEYIGDYHIHPEKGPMVGATHINTPHDYLYPTLESNTFTTGSIISPPTPEPLTYNSPTLGGGGGGY